MAYCLLDGAQSSQSQSPVPARRQSPVVGSLSPLSSCLHSLTFVLHYPTHSLSLFLSAFLSLTLLTPWPTHYHAGQEVSRAVQLILLLPTLKINKLRQVLEGRKECLGNSTTLKGSSNFMLYANVIYASL